MKFLPKISLFTVLTLCSMALTSDGAVIDLRNPVSSSLEPDILYYQFDTAENNVTENHVTPGTYDGNFAKGSFTVPVLAPGKEGFGQSLDLAGGPKPDSQTLNPFVTVSGGNDLNFNARSFTLGVWIQFDSFLPSAETQRIILMEKGSTGVNTVAGFSFYLERTPSEETTPMWTLKLEMRNGTHTRRTALSVAADLGFEDLDWHHVGFSLDPETETVAFWADGKPLAIDDASLYLGIGAGTNAIRIGERATNGYWTVFDGRIDDFFITSGVQTFAIPEPAPVSLMIGAAGVFLMGWMRRTRL